MRLNASSGLLELSESALLHSPQIDAVGKNWTPFQFEWSNASYSNYNSSSEVATSEDGDFSTHNNHNTSKNSGKYIYRNHSIDGGDSILFIVNINPLHVVELTPEFEYINGSRRAVLRNIVKNSKKDTSLPWTVRLTRCSYSTSINNYDVLHILFHFLHILCFFLTDLFPCRLVHQLNLNHWKLRRGRNLAMY